jgi:hypothetical protein
MKIVDPHVHCYSRTTDDYEKMSLADIRCVVEPSFWLGGDRRYPGTFWDYFNHITAWEPNRAAKFGVCHYCAIGVNPKEAEDVALSRETIAGMDEYIERENVVAIGELGFNKITKNEEVIFREQLLIAERRRLPVIIHTPHLADKVPGTTRSIAIIKEMKLTQDRICIDHNTEDTMPMAKETDCWLGMTIYPGKLSPERAAKIILEYGVDKVLVNSAADWGPSNPLSVPVLIRELRKVGLAEREIEKLVWDNPNTFFGRSENWKADGK